MPKTAVRERQDGRGTQAQTARVIRKAIPEAALGVEIRPPRQQTFTLTLIGDTRLVVNRKSEKAKEEMRRKQQKKARGPREAKDPEAQYEASRYRLPDGPDGFPAVGFKKSAVNAGARYVNGMEKKKTWLQGTFRVLADGISAGDDGTDLVRIEGSKPKMREDMVRLQGKTADLRYRAEYFPWRVTLTIRHNPDIISVERIVNLFQYAGMHVGVGEDRPEKQGGDWGLFHVADKNEAHRG